MSDQPAQPASKEADSAERLVRFAKLVKQMRDAQVVFFRTGGGVSSAKAIEKEVDRQLAILLPSPQSQLWS